ncbi:hypothetical protein OROMI_008836 [Orobanche minor]
MAPKFIEFASTRSTARKLNHHREPATDHHQSLLPGLPDDVAQLCLSRLPPSVLYSVCRSWRRLIYSHYFPPFLSLYAVVLPTGENQSHISNSIELCSFDPISSKWHILPPPPSDPPPKFLFRHRSFISRDFAIQTVSVSGKLVVLAATDDDFQPALSRPLVFDPLSNKWSDGPPFSAPRRWCAVGASRGDVYVASGMGATYHRDVAWLAEKWELGTQRSVLEHRQRCTWRKMRNLNVVRFSCDAIEAVGWRGKLCMVNMKGDSWKEGLIYDVETDSWGNMPAGMLAGWRGPAAAMAEETIYVVHESKGLLRKYDPLRDAWADVAESAMLRGARQVAAAVGKVCVLCADGVSIVVVDVAAPPPAKLFVVHVPSEVQVVGGIHVLPRFMTC